MPNYNLVVLMGHMTRDPEVAYTPKGTAICNFGLAINRYWKDDQGNKKEKVAFIECQAWNNNAEIIGQRVKKGHSLHVSGSIEQDTWDDKQTGQKRSKLFVRVDSVQLLGQKESSAPSQPSKPSQPPRTSRPPVDPDLDPDDDGSDIPF